MRGYCNSYQQKVVIFGFTVKILEDAVLPQLFHLCPVVDLTLSNWIVDTQGLGVSESFVTNVEVHVIQVRWFGQVKLLGSNSGGNDVAWFSVSSEPHLGVPTI